MLQALADAMKKREKHKQKNTQAFAKVEKKKKKRIDVCPYYALHFLCTKPRLRQQRPQSSMQAKKRWDATVQRTHKVHRLKRTRFWRCRSTGQWGSRGCSKGMAVTLAGLGVKDEGNNETVETKDLSENENQNHADEKLGLLNGTTDTRVTNNTNGETSGKTGDTDGETGTKVDEAVEQRVVSANVVGNEDGHDETVNGNDTPM